MKTSVQTGHNRRRLKVGIAWFRVMPWFSVVGSILFFASWILQNRFASRWTEQRLHLERGQLVIDVQEVRMEQWQIPFLQERYKREPDKRLLAASALKLIQSLSNLNYWSAARVATGPTAEKLIGEKNALQDKALELYRDGQVDALVKLYESSTVISNRMQIPEVTTQAFGDRLREVNRNEDWYNVTFFITYCIGTLMIGWEWVRNRRIASAGERK